jgi:predicted PurR-regulated permease PerM
VTQSRSPYGVLAATLFIVLFLLFAYSVAEVLLLLFAAALFALYLGAFTDFLESRLRLPRPVGVAVGFLSTMALLGLIGGLIIPPVLAQTQELVSALPGLLAQWESSLFRLATRYPVLSQMMPASASGHGYFDAALKRMGGYFAGLVPYVFTGVRIVIDVISVLVMGMYLALRPQLYRAGVIALVPLVHRSLANDILDDLSHTLRSWIVGQLLAMSFLGILTWMGLLLLHVPYALAFGVFTALVVIVPFFGTLVSTLLPALFVLGQGDVLHALLVVLLGVFLHLVEANLVQPMIMERAVKLPPVLSVLSVLVMAKLLGIIGLLVAVPVLATTLVLVRRIYVHRIVEGKGFRRTLRDPEDAEPGAAAEG